MLPLTFAKNWYGLASDATNAFRLVTDFNLKEFAPDRNSLHHVNARMTSVHPTKDKKKYLEANFANDLEHVNDTLAIEKRAALTPTYASAEYRWNVMHPGKETLYIQPQRTFFLPDRNRIFTMYIRGAGRAHHVFALFEGPNKIKQEIFVASLDFKGWKRFEVVIPPYLRLRNPKKYNRYELYFLGLKVQSYFRDEPGTSVFNLAEMFILADTSDRLIPGADMPPMK
ncbi:MAG TPA: hypothetical protein PLY93_10920 [Turneriella sp.]|nr:hypothetical protein [Turneriella sp.]